MVEVDIKVLSASVSSYVRHTGRNTGLIGVTEVHRVWGSCGPGRPWLGLGCVGPMVQGCVGLGSSLLQEVGVLFSVPEHAVLNQLFPNESKSLNE